MLGLTKRNVVTSSWVAVFLCKPKIDNKGGEALIIEAHQYILWFDVAMDMTMRVDLLKVRNLKDLKYQC